MVNKNLVSNSAIILREDFDDWVLVFNPDTNEIFTLNPIGAFILKCLDGKTSLEEIVEKIKEVSDNVPVNALDYIKDFIGELIKFGLVSCK